MGDRFHIPIVCPDCKYEDTAYYAPTCDFLIWTCKCGCVVDLEEYTGISEEDASNRVIIDAIVGTLTENHKT